MKFVFEASNAGDKPAYVCSEPGNATFGELESFYYSVFKEAFRASIHHYRQGSTALMADIATKEQIEMASATALLQNVKKALDDLCKEESFDMSQVYSLMRMTEDAERKAN